MQELVRSGPDEVHGVVKRIIVEAASSASAAASSRGPLHSAPRGGEDLHNLAPLGARVSVNAAAVHRTGEPLLPGVAKVSPWSRGAGILFHQPIEKGSTLLIAAQEGQS